MLELRNVSCGYGSIVAVEDLSFRVRPGTVYGLLGPNGAGKTSTLMTIMGHVRQTAGAILFESQDISRARPDERTALGLAIVPEGRRIFVDLTTEENLVVGGYRTARAVAARNLDRVYAIFPRLAERRKQICGSMSGGEQQMVSFGRALMSEPRLILVDELSLGLMPKAASVFVEVLARLRGEGVTTVLVDQSTSRVLRLADEVTLLSTGRSVFAGKAAACAADSKLFERFIGTAL